MSRPGVDLQFGPPPTHYGMMSDASFVVTRKLLAVERLVRLVTSSHQAALIFGDAGLGKTTAVRYVLSVRLRKPFAEVTFSGSPHPRENVDTLHRAILGRPGVGTAAKIEGELRREVREHDVILVVDEVESIKIERLTALRKLQDVPGARLSVIYIGDAKSKTRMQEDKRLTDRLLTGLEFKRMNFEQFTEKLTDYHPLYEGVPSTVVKRLHDHVLHGSWRAIAKFTLCAQFVIDFDDELVGERSLVNSDVVSRATRLFWDGAPSA